MYSIIYNTQLCFIHDNSLTGVTEYLVTSTGFNRFSINLVSAMSHILMTPDRAGNSSGSNYGNRGRIYSN